MRRTILKIANKIGFFGIPANNTDDLSRWRSYWLLAPHAVAAVTLGWACVILSTFFAIRPEGSGALLVGAAILAQFFHSKWLYRKLLNVDIKTFMLPTISRVYHLNPRALLSLSVADDFYPGSRRNGEVAAYSTNWIYPRTVDRIDQRLELIIMLSVFSELCFGDMAT